MFKEAEKMTDSINFDLLPENTVVLSGPSLSGRRHMPAPPDLTIVVRSPEQAGHLYEILREEYPENHPLRLMKNNGYEDISLADLSSGEELLIGTGHLVIPPLPERGSFEDLQNT
ncbi:MAG: hypothetical protein IKP86_10460, partial [Anaerolineaceae bacterium]|nr:hypothetical protein [Anaerolineaceae bacterium]